MHPLPVCAGSLSSCLSSTRFHQISVCEFRSNVGSVNARGGSLTRSRRNLCGGDSIIDGVKPRLPWMVPFSYCRSSAQATPSSATLTEAAHKRAVRFRPCIDIHKGNVKQIVGSSLQDTPTEEGSSDSLIINFETKRSAAEYAKMYKEDGLWGGHVIMLSADSASRAVALEALTAYPGGLQIGGGLNPENAMTYLDAGASHVIVTSYVFREGNMDQERLKDLVRIVGKQRLVLDLSCRKKDGHYFVVTDRWQRFSNLAISEETLVGLAASADEFLVHGVDVEGKRLGIDEELVGLLGKWSPIPVTYAGGASSLFDVELIKDAGLGFVDVTMGSALDIFGGEVPYIELVDWHRQQEALVG